MGLSLLSQDDITTIINETREEVYSVYSYRKFIGTILIELKRVVVPNCDLKEIRHKLCKGETTHHINPHQACHGAAVYACQYYVKEGYDLESAKQLGCRMWNEMNQCRFFPIWKSKLSTVKWGDEDIHASVFDRNMRTLEKVCRQQHRVCDLSTISEFTYKSGKMHRKVTFWICFDNAIANLAMTEVITKSEVHQCLRAWNLENEADLFVV